MKNKKIFSRLSACLLSLSVLTLSLPLSSASGEASGINVNYRTKAEIIQYMNDHPFEYIKSEYDSVPNYTDSPYSPGALSQNTLDNALNALNTVRYIAGIDEVALSDKYNEYAQAATLVNAVNNQLSHSPEQPSGMSDELYQKGLSGASSANLGWGYSNLPQDIIYGWMSDASSSNIDRVGHRRWCLNPSMEYTGFGNTGSYYAMYAFDNTFGNTDYYGVSWPAQVMPEEYFEYDDPWSISMGYSVDKSSVEVTLTRNSDGKVWNFSESSADGYFNVENSYYGKQGCIIFRPSDIEGYAAGDSYTVSITGLKSDVTYDVDFINLESEPEITVSDLIELVKYLTKQEHNADSIRDLNVDDHINIFDAIYARRELMN